MMQSFPIRLGAWVVLGLVGLFLPGCGRGVVQADNPAAVPPRDYDLVFDATVAALRDMHFTLDRQDRRFGVVTTQPMLAASVFEPWRADNTTGAQVAESTLNDQRRRVRVTLAPSAVEEEPAEYHLQVEVTVERRQMPRRQINSAAAVHLKFDEGVNRSRELLTEAGLEKPHWRPMGRDPYLEQRLVADILRRAFRTASKPVPAES